MKVAVTIFLLLVMGCFTALALAEESHNRENAQVALACGVSDRTETWSPYSPGARSETGPIKISSKRIQFAERGFILMKLLSANGEKPDIRGIKGDIYQITKVHPKLQLSSVSELCPNQSLGYVRLTTLSIYPKARGCSIVILPTVPAEDGQACAHYNYTDRQLPELIPDPEFMKLLKN